MASVEHCLYCFETLVAQLEGRKSMTLDEIEESWEEYQSSSSGAAAVGAASSSPSATKTAPALRRVADALAGGDNSTSSISSSSSASGSTMSLATPSATGGTDTPDTSTSSLPSGSSRARDVPADENTPLVTESPLFVTWNKISSRTGEPALRGCIGTFESQELDEGLSSYAIISALQDTRFDPIAKSELPKLEVCVTLLTDFEDCDDAMDWEVGKHGLRISFTERGRRYGSTYLPDVAAEQGWTKEETLVSLMRKAGWVGRKDSWRDIQMKVVRYQGKKKEVRWAEFKHWRDWATEREGQQA